MRLAGKVAIVVGAGQQAGQGIGNGRATAILFAREGAAVLLVDRDEASATETLRMVEAEGGAAAVLRADITDEDACRSIAATCMTCTAASTFWRMSLAWAWATAARRRWTRITGTRSWTST